MISIAMTTYNGETYIARQLETLWNQSVPADEIVICDDGSCDATIEIIRIFIEEHQAANIRLVKNEENLGYIRNFYKAISLTKGDYIFLADQDDEWHENKIERTLQTMESEGASAVCTNCFLIDAFSKNIQDNSHFDRNPFIDNVTQRITPISFYELVIGNIAQGCTYCFTRQVKDAYLQVNSRNLIHDYQIMFVAAVLGNVYFLDEALIDYRLHNSNVVGFADAKETTKVHWKIPTLKPVMVRFLEDLERALYVPNVTFYKLLYYLRIPYFISVLRRKRRIKKSIPKEENKL